MSPVVVVEVLFLQALRTLIRFLRPAEVELVDIHLAHTLLELMHLPPNLVLMEIVRVLVPVRPEMAERYLRVPPAMVVEVLDGQGMVQRPTIRVAELHQ
jgi:hypothetical protein